jgi:capsular exopolysaccharide synthesis family protein
MDFRDYLLVFKRRWPIVAIFLILGIAGSVGYLSVAAKTYEATSVVYVSVNGSSNSVDLAQGSTFSQQAATNYAAITKSPLVLSPVIDQLSLTMTSAELAKNLSVTPETGTSLFDITATAGNAAEAAQIANAVAKSATEQITELETPADPTTEAIVSLKQIQTATIPKSAAAPSVKTTLAFGVVVGLVLGIALSVLLHVLDTRIRGIRDIAQLTSRPLLASVPRRKAKEGALVVKDFPDSTSGESFRGLRTNLRFVEVEHNRSFVISAAAQNDRPAEVAANLAWALAETGSTVVLVDVDLRDPHVESTFEMPAGRGVTDVVTGNAKMAEVVRPGGLDTLWIVTAGKPTSNPSELLGSDEMHRFVDQLEAAFDFVIFDSPPMLAYTDAAVVSALATGAVITVQAGKARRRELKEALTVLSNLNLEPVGVVLTGA